MSTQSEVDQKQKTKYFQSSNIVPSETLVQKVESSLAI